MGKAKYISLSLECCVCVCVCVKNTKLTKVLTFRRVSWLEDRGQINLISSISCFQDDTRPA